MFARLRALSLLKKDAADPADAEPELPPTSVAKRSAETQSEPTAEATEGSSEPPGEESIDDYMGRLLQRMRGIAGEASSTPAPAKSDRSSPSRPKEHPEATPTKSMEDSSTIAKKLLKLEPRQSCSGKNPRPGGDAGNCQPQRPLRHCHPPPPPRRQPGLEQFGRGIRWLGLRSMAVDSIPRNRFTVLLRRFDGTGRFGVLVRQGAAVGTQHAVIEAPQSATIRRDVARAKRAKSKDRRQRRW